MSETRKIAAILVADVVGFSRLAGADEDRTLSRLRGLRSDLIDPAIAAHHGRIFKRTGDGILIEFRSVVDAVRCAIEVQNGLIERNAGLPPERRIEFRVGIHLGDVVEESDGDLMGDGVNIAARLEGICMPGAICLSEDAYRQVKGRLDLAVSDLGPTQLKNIADPVRVYSLEVGKPAIAKPVTEAKPAEPKKRSQPAALGAGIVALIVIAAGAWYFLGANRAAEKSAHLSIVVLPFANLSGDPAQDYFADGITDNLTTDLSRAGMFVIARNTALTYKGRNADAKEIGKELGVRYVLEGSVQRDQNRARVNAQLINSETGAHLWADRFDEDVADLFKLQDQVVEHLGRHLNLALTKAEAERGGRSKNPDAVDLTMRGDYLMWQCPKEFRDCVREARALYERALQIDPNEIGALNGAAQTYVFDWNHGWGDPGTDYDAKILGPANQAINLAPDNPGIYFAKAQYLGLSGQPSEALDAADAELAINPNDIGLLTARAIAENSLGQYEQAKADMKRAIQLSPRDPQVGVFHIDLGEAEIGLGHFDAAIDEFRKAINSGYRPFYAYTNLAAAYAHAGKMDEAKAALAEARRLNPAITIKWLKEHTPNLPVSFDGLRMAGLPEDAPAEPAHLSIVVLPFTNLSNDPAQDYFADGVTDNLTTDLSRIRNSFVIARNTAFTYKVKSIDAKEIGKELGVRYVLEGSVQREGTRVRVNAQLIDAESGAHIWAERFEEDVADLFKLQDQVVAQLANTLGFELVKAEAEKSARSHNPDAIDLTMRGLALLQQATPQPIKEQHDGLKAALAFFDQALKIDANNADALAGEAAAYHAEYQFGWTSAETDLEAKIVDQANRAIALDPNSARAYFAKASYLMLTHRADEGLRAANAGLAINPNFAPLYGARSAAETSLGNFEAAKSDAQRAILLSPRDPLLGLRYVNIGIAELGLGRYDAAIDGFHKAIDVGYANFIPYADLAAVYALEGRTDEMRTALIEARRLNPDLTVKWLIDHAPNLPALFEGLRKAGLPEE